MFQWLKMHFIPHEGNAHRPHILHQKNVHRIIGFVIFIEAFAFLIPTIALITEADTGNVVPQILSTLINNERAKFNLPALTDNALLDAVAQAKANDMAANSYFAHTSPDGKTPWFWFDQSGYKYRFAGENLAINFTNANDITAAWMSSETHRANILKASYTEVGTGVASGVYQGYPTIFVAQDFGSPLVVTPTEPIQEPTPVDPTTTSQLSVVRPTAILGAETGKSATVIKTPKVAVVAQPQEKPIETAIVASEPIAPVISPTINQTQPTFIQRMLASPRTTTNIILAVILGIVVLALGLNIGIKISHHHPDLILNGVMVIAIIGAVFVMNGYIKNSNPISTDSVDFSADHTVL